MIRPCDQCGGSGEIATLGPDHTDPCPRCVDMPWLPARYAAPWVQQVYEQFKPDPDTVEWRCQDWYLKYWYTTDGYGINVRDDSLTIKPPCHPGAPHEDCYWVAVPERLKIASVDS